MVPWWAGSTRILQRLFGCFDPRGLMVCHVAHVIREIKRKYAYRTPDRTYILRG